MRPCELENIPEVVAENVRRLRTCQGWTMTRLAEVSGVHRVTLSHIEHADCEDMNLSTVAALASALGVRASVLLSSKQ